jgi:hypothetical protein
MLSQLKKLFEPMADDMTSTKHHIKQIERRHNEFGDDTECAIGPAIGGFSIDVKDEGPVKLKLHIRG